MSRLYHIGPPADAGGMPFLRGGTPTNDLSVFGAQYIKVGGSTLASFNNSLAVIGSSGILTAVTSQYFRFKVRLRRLPLQTTTILAINSTIEGTPAVLIAVSTTGQIRAYNQGNQATYAQLIGNVGTPSVGEWNEYSLFVRFRTASVLGHLTMQRFEDGGVTDTLDWVGGTSGFGLELSGAQTRTTQFGGTGGSSGGNDGLDFDICELVSDDAVDPGVSRVSYLRTAANGRFQEFTSAGIADWRARWMFPYSNFTTAATYAVRTLTSGQKQSYVMQSFASQGITGTIKSAMFYCYTGSTGAPTTAPTLLIRRTTAGGVITDTSVTLYTVAAFSFLIARIDDAVNWLATDTIEIGIQCNSGSGVALGSFFLSIEHTTPYVAPTDTDFSCALTQWTGNGTVQTITAPNGLTPDFIWWMPATATSAGGGFWHRSMGSSQAFANFGGVHPWIQVDGPNIYLIGNEAESPNVSGRVFDVLIISDPTRRMLSPYSQTQASNVNWDNYEVPIYDGEGNPFAPTFAMGVLESPGTSVSGYMRGPGQTGDSSGLIIGQTAPVTDVFQAFESAGLQLGQRFPGVVGAQFAFAAFRSDFIGSSFFSLSSYVGDAAVSRDITLNMPGYSPTWICVFTLTSSGGRNSQISTPTTAVSRNVQNGTSQTDSILSRGSNRITVGSGLNQTGATYVVFAIAAGVDAEPEPEPEPGPYPGPPLPSQDPVPSTLNATLLTLRRLRRFPHISNEEFRIFYHRLEIDMEAGVGLGGVEQVGSAPQVMLRWSDDGGMTWSAEHWVSAGRIGLYGWRVLWNRLGDGRDRVFEIVVTDPVAWRFVDAYLQIAMGNS